MTRKLQATIFGAGTPTQPDVRRLRARWPEIQIGQQVGHDEIEGIIAAGRKSYRYSTVVSAWRRQVEREQGVILGAVPGVGYKALAAPERVDLSYAKAKHAGRSMKRAATIAATTDSVELTAEDRARVDHLCKSAAAVLGALRLAPGKMTAEALKALGL